MSESKPTFTRGETPHWTYPCGCQASALRLARCPLHDAAQELLAALDAATRVLATLDTDAVFRAHRLARFDNYDETLDAARAAIAKAKP